MKSDMVKVLLIDRDPERRKERIAVLKEHGYKVFPALDIQQAKERCKPGVYDLIAVNSGEQAEMAREFCDSILRKDPGQAVLLMAGESVQQPRRDYMVAPEQLLERIESMFKRVDTADKAA